MLSSEDTDASTIIARFSAAPFVPGDADSDGVLTVTDALVCLRLAMGIVELPSEMQQILDMDSDGSVTVTDAIIILRTAMGII